MTWHTGGGKNGWVANKNSWGKFFILRGVLFFNWQIFPYIPTKLSTSLNGSVSGQISLSGIGSVQVHPPLGIVSAMLLAQFKISQVSGDISLDLCRYPGDLSRKKKYLPINFILFLIPSLITVKTGAYCETWFNYLGVLRLVQPRPGLWCLSVIVPGRILNRLFPQTPSRGKAPALFGLKLVHHTRSPRNPNRNRSFSKSSTGKILLIF